MSPIHDQTYRRFQGPKFPPGRAWTVILWVGVRGMLDRKALLGLLLLPWIVFLGFTIYIYFHVAIPQAGSFVQVDARMFRRFVEVEGFVGFFITLFVGSGLIANDRRANALQVYLSKPLMRTEYIGGKLGILMVFLALSTLVPGWLLIVMQIALSGSFDFIRANNYIVPAVTLSCLIRVIVPAVTMLALSSLSKSPRFVAVMYAAVILFSEPLYGVLRLLTGSSRVAWVSIMGNFDVVTDAMFRLPPRFDTPVSVSALVLLGLVAVSISVLERRVRGVEVVS